MKDKLYENYENDEKYVSMEKSYELIANVYRKNGDKKLEIENRKKSIELINKLKNDISKNKILKYTTTEVHSYIF